MNSLPKVNELVKSSWAMALINPEFICINTFSGYRATHLDVSGRQHIAALDALDSELGFYVLDALSYSRFVLPKPRPDVWIHPEVTFDPVFYEPATIEKDNDGWIEHLVSKFHYPNSRALFKKMHSVSIECTNGIITMCPSHHVKFDYWNGEGISDEDYVKVATSSPPEDIGAALRLAFSRCIG